MVECPRCGQESELVAGEVFVLVWCDSCTDLIEVGDLALQLMPPREGLTLAAADGAASP